MKVKWLMGITLWGTLKFRKSLFCNSISTVYKDKKCHCVCIVLPTLYLWLRHQHNVNYYNMLIIIKLFWSLLLFFLSFITLYNNYRATEHYVELDIISEIKNIIVRESTDFELIFKRRFSIWIVNIVQQTNR